VIVEILTALARDHLSDFGGVAPRNDVVEWIEQRLIEGPVGDAPPGRVDDGLAQAVAGGPLMAVRHTPDEADDDTLLADLTVVAEHLAFTHRLTAEEIASDHLDLERDLTVLARVAEADGGLHLPTGEPLALRRTDPDEGERSRYLSGPAGWLTELGADTVVVASAADGFLSLLPQTPEDAQVATTNVAEFVDHLRPTLIDALAAANAGDGTAVSVEELQAAGIVDGWLEPGPDLPPFGEVLVAAGLELKGPWVGDAAAIARVDRLGDVMGPISRHGDHLDTTELKALTGLLDGFAAWREDHQVVLDRHVITRLHRTAEAGLCLEEELVRADGEGVELTEFLTSIPRPGTKADAVLDSYLALAAELTGSGEAAEPLLDAAMATSPDWFPATEARAHLYEVRGRSQEAINLLQSTRAGTDEELQILRLRSRLTNPDVGRNDPCPCRSGRKYKQCHQGKAFMPPEVQVAWLLDKARAHLTRLGPMAVADQLPVRNDLHPDAELMALDVALFDLGVLQRFLDARRTMLPAEEVSLLETWLVEQRPGVYRIGSLQSQADAPLAGGVAELVDVVTGVTLEVQRTDLFHDEFEVDDEVWCRLLPAGGTWWTSGFVRDLEADEVAVLLAASAPGVNPIDRYQALVGLGPSIRIDASDGNPLVVATGSWPVGDDRPGAEAALGAALTIDGDRWTVSGTSDDDDPAATVTLLDPLDLSAFDEELAQEPGAENLEQVLLVVHADSIPRFRRACEVAEGIFPGAGIIHSMIVPVARHRAMAVDDDLLEHLYVGTPHPDDDLEFTDDERG